MTVEKIPGIKHIIAVASGKGGVGKSTVSVNLALALRDLGATVGLVDGDVLGPSIPSMLGVPYGKQPETIGGQLIPVTRYGIETVSMGMLTDHDAPAILRGPMVTKYMRLFVQQVAWSPLDYLIIDLPPGTGDIQLTLAQSIPLSGAVVVTTPQDVSLNIARRGLRMFEKVGVPILGLVENMSGFTCPHCNTTTHVFREGGGRRLADAVHIPVLGSIPLDANIVVGGDAGRPIVVEMPESLAARAYAKIAKSMIGRLLEVGPAAVPAFKWTWDSDEGAPAWREELIDRASTQTTLPIGIRKRDARTLSVLWKDGRCDHYDVRDLRLVCPCAMCVDEMSGKRTLDPATIPMDVAPRMLASVGQYAISVTWSDGHSTGIYAFERLRHLGEQTHSQQAGYDV